MGVSGPVLIVGAGFSGGVMARELAAAGVECVVIDRRDHVAGNCHTERDPATGILLHCYGAHIFNTHNKTVWEYVNRFVTFRTFLHRVKATTACGVFSLPVNLLTLNQFFGKTLSPAGARDYVEQLGDRSIQEPRNFEEAALRLIGPELYETFFRGYTQKQWGEDPRTLPAALFKRLPIRFDYNDNYFDAPYQGMPEQGYTDLTLRLLDHPRIRTELSTPFDPSMRSGFAHTVYSGPIDQYFGCDEGRLGYRTVYWDRETLAGDAQGVACMNYTQAEIPWTRKVEHKHLAPWESHEDTVRFTEYSKETTDRDEPFYPKRLSRDKELLACYQDRALSEPEVTFVGRLGTYRYLDMDDTIAEAMRTAEELLKKLR